MSVVHGAFIGREKQGCTTIHGASVHAYCMKSDSVACSCHRVWDGRHSTCTKEPAWRGPITVARVAVAFQVPMS